MRADALNGIYEINKTLDGTTTVNFSKNVVVN